MSFKVCVCVCVCIYIYIYGERERERMVYHINQETLSEIKNNPITSGTKNILSISKVFFLPFAANFLSPSLVLSNL